MWIKNVGHQLCHEADSDELRAVAEESAGDLHEYFYWQKSHKPGAGQHWVVCRRMWRDTLPGRQYHADLMSGE